METTVFILMAEDSELDAELAMEHLRLAGIPHVMERVDNRADFVRKLEESSPDLILSDYAMPAFDGLEALDIAQRLRPEAPFLFVSGVMGEEVTIETLKRGAVDYVLKHRLGRLGFSVQRALAEAKQRREHKQAQEEVARKARELMVLNGDLEQFVYAASHDLQEPLRTMSIFSRLLANKYRGVIDEQADEYLGYLESAARHMSALLEDLLLYAKIPVKERRPEEIDLTEVLEQTLFLFQVAIAEAKAVITYDRLPRVFANASQVGLVFQNLIGNALKYRSSEPPRVHIACVRESDGWVISVKDNGVGFEPSYADYVFGLFKRLHDRQSSGTGLGLAISKRIIEMHGGKIWVESKPNEGSTFYFSLPDRVPNEVRQEKSATEQRKLDSMCEVECDGN